MFKKQYNHLRVSKSWKQEIVEKTDTQWNVFGHHMSYHTINVYWTSGRTYPHKQNTVDELQFSRFKFVLKICQIYISISNLQYKGVIHVDWNDCIW